MALGKKSKEIAPQAKQTQATTLFNTSCQVNKKEFKVWVNNIK